MTTFDDLHDARLLALIADGDGRRFTLRFKTDAGNWYGLRGSSKSGFGGK